MGLSNMHERIKALHWWGGLLPLKKFMRLREFLNHLHHSDERKVLWKTPKDLTNKDIHLIYIWWKETQN